MNTPLRSFDDLPNHEAAIPEIREKAKEFGLKYGTMIGNITNKGAEKFEVLSRDEWRDMARIEIRKGAVHYLGLYTSMLNSHGIGIGNKLPSIITEAFETAATMSGPEAGSA